jgi:disulfide bond formation protein DsbB
MTDTMSLFFSMLTIVALLSAAGSMVFVSLAATTSGGMQLIGRARSFFADYALILAFLVALTATLGSLFYSEVANFIPCKLCWYQRIAMYPLVVVLGIAALRKDVAIKKYVLPIVVIGSLISTYHYLIERFPDLSGGTCDPTAPCTVTLVWKLGFISIPFMALAGFLLIATLMLWLPSKESHSNGPNEEENQ